MKNGLYTNNRGTKCWYLNDKLHREDGPAADYISGNKFWYLNGKLHRENGPAIEHSDSEKCWYLNGKNLTEKEFIKHTRKLKLINLYGPAI